jgi:YVTN family beta-propeller protein
MAARAGCHAGSAPYNSTTLIVEGSSGADRIWNVDPDDHSVTVTSAAGAVVAQIQVGDRPWSLAKAPLANEVFVANKGAATISVISTQTLAVVRTIALPTASQPHGLAFAPAGNAFYVALEGLARVDKRTPSSGALVASAALSGRPRHLAVSGDGATLYVSNFITPPLPGESTATIDMSAGGAQMFVVATSGMTLSQTIAFGRSSKPVSATSGPGMPNYLNAPVLFGSKAYVPSKQDNLDAGGYRGGAGMTFDQTVRAVTSIVDLPSGVEQTALRIDHDNAGVATGAAISGEGRTLVVALETSREVAAYDTQQGFEIARLAVGRAPQGVAFSSNGRTLYVHNFMDRSVSRFDVTNLVALHVDAGAAARHDDRLTAVPPANEAARQAALLRRAGRPARARQLPELRVVPQRRRRRRRGLGPHRLRRGPAQHDRPARPRPAWATARCTGPGTSTRCRTSRARSARSRRHRAHDQRASSTRHALAAARRSEGGVSSDLDALAAYVASLTSAPASPQRAAATSPRRPHGPARVREPLLRACHMGPPFTDSAPNYAPRRGHDPRGQRPAPGRSARRLRHADADRCLEHRALSARRLGGHARGGDRRHAGDTTTPAERAADRERSSPS